MSGTNVCYEKLSKLLRLRKTVLHRLFAKEYRLIWTALWSLKAQQKLTVKPYVYQHELFYANLLDANFLYKCKLYN